jgi:hypothetical protein
MDCREDTAFGIVSCPAITRKRAPSGLGLARYQATSTPRHARHHIYLVFILVLFYFVPPCPLLYPIRSTLAPWVATLPIHLFVPSSGHFTVCVPLIAARQWGLLFDKGRNQPFSLGALGEQSSGPPPPPSQAECSVSVYIPPIVARQRLGKHVPVATNTHATI